MSRRVRQKLTIGGVAGIIILAVIAIRSRAPRLDALTPMPRLHFEETEVDLGQIPVSYKTHDVRFPFVNRGQSDLRITELVTSCGCAAARVEPDVVPPDQSGAVVVAIRTVEPEEKATWVTVHSNDPRQPRTTLEMYWRSVAPLEFDPLAVDFGQVLPESMNSRTVRVVRRELSDFTDEGEIQRIEAFPQDEVEATLNPAGQIEITLTTGRREGVAEGHLDAYLSGGWRESLRLPLTWDVRDVVQASPSELFAGSGSPRSLHQRDIVITAAGDVELSLESVSLKGDVIVSDVPWTRSSANTVVIHLECRFPKGPGAWTSELVVVCRRPKEHVLNVPVSGYVEESTTGNGVESSD